jgi:hypothetical protein
MLFYGARRGRKYRLQQIKKKKERIRNGFSGLQSSRTGAPGTLNAGSWIISYLELQTVVVVVFLLRGQREEKSTKRASGLGWAENWALPLAGKQPKQAVVTKLSSLQANLAKFQASVRTERDTVCRHCVCLCSVGRPAVALLFASASDRTVRIWVWRPQQSPHFVQ